MNSDQRPDTPLEEQIEPGNMLPSDPTAEQSIRVGILEDERHVREILCRFLRAERMEPVVVKNGNTAERLTASGYLGLLLVDLGLGSEDGIRIIRRIRATSSIPIIVVSGRTEIETVSCGLDAGADDYLRKPIAFEELGARIRSVMRRKAPASPTSAAPTASDVGGLKIDLSASIIEGPLGKQPLTEREVLILSQLLRNIGSPVSRNTLSRSLVGQYWDPNNRTLDVHIANIRRKIVLTGGDQRIIRTRRNLGYQIAPSPGSVTPSPEN